MLAFFILAFAISWAAVFLERAARQALFPEAVLFTLNLMVKFGPSAAGLIVVGATERAGGIRELLSGLLKWRVALYWYVLALFGPAALMLAAITLSLPLDSRALENADWRWPGSTGLLLSLFATRFFIGGGLGEELGWRGFALPRLQARYGVLRASLLIGLMWGLWHLPGNLSSASPVLALIAQMILTLSLSIIFTWVYHKTGGSLLVVSLLHATNNAYSAFFETALPALGDEIGWIALYLLFIIGVAAIVIGKGWLTSSPRGRQAVGRARALSVMTGRGVRRALFWALALALLLAGTGLVYQSLSAASDVRRYPPPGDLVDVGGYRLYIYCIGEGSPTVVLESGLGGPALEWAAVQPGVAKMTRVWGYDRAGYGWSDSAPPGTPRASRQIVDELHTLLTNAGVKGPYVLVGHSFGGFNVRLYASQYPQDVAGLVLVAAGHEDMFSRMPPEFTRITESNRQVDKIMQPLTILGLTRLAGQAGLLASFTGLLEGLLSGTQAEFVALSLYRARYWDTRAKESASLEASMSQVRAAGSLGDLPLVVLSGEPDLGRVPPDFPADKVRETARALQVELAQLSTNSTRIVCDTCGHYIPLTNPELVVQAIHQVIER